MMTLYSGTTDPFSQRCRIVLHEKGMDFQIIDVDLDHKPEDLAVMNPYNQVPVLVERDLILHESNIINEYIDERFPHPQLMPADPLMRARARLFLHRFEKELFSHIDTLEGNNQKQLDKARGLVRDSLMQMAPVFAKHKYMLGEDFSMLDVAITPLLWRLDYYGIQLPKPAAPLMKYAERLFSRPGVHRGAHLGRAGDAEVTHPPRSRHASACNWDADASSPRRRGSSVALSPPCCLVVSFSPCPSSPPSRISSAPSANGARTTT